MPVEQIRQHNLSPPAFDILGAYNFINRIVGTFYQNVRLEGADQLKRRILTEDNHRIHIGKRRQHCRAAGFVLYRSAFTFQADH